MSSRPAYCLSRSRRLHFEPLEPRLPMSAAPLFASSALSQSVTVSATTGDKPQSKVWEHDGAWFSVLPDSSGTWVRRLDDNHWTSVLKLSSDTKVHADVKQDGDLVHVLLFDGTRSQMTTLEFVGGQAPTYQSWTLNPTLVDVVLSKGVEMATIDLDSTGRMWLASDAVSTIEVRYSDFPYASFSKPITIASGIGADDICSIAAMPQGDVGVLWSDQHRKAFGFRLHVDGSAPAVWSATEIPAAQSRRNLKGGMADDHIHLAVAQDGTVYAAVKTSFDTPGQPLIGLLVRRPSGHWDRLYTVDTSGTRPIVVLNEAAQRLVVIYTSKTAGGDIVYRESPMGAISFGPRQTLLKGKFNDATSTKASFDDELVVFASSGAKAVSVRLKRIA